MRPISSSPPVPFISHSADEEGPSPNIEPNNVPFDGVYGRVDPNAPSRAQIRAELAEAKAAGLVTFGELDFPLEPPATGVSKTRQQVLDELAEANANKKEKAAGKDRFEDQESF